MFAQNCINGYQEATYQYRLGRGLFLIYIQYQEPYSIMPIMALDSMYWLLTEH